jgi:FixJ family two-component response regulator
LSVADRTIKAERAKLMAKLGVGSAAELGRLAERLRHLSGE